MWIKSISRLVIFAAIYAEKSNELNAIIAELLAKMLFLQEAPKMEIAKLLWYKE